MELSKCLENRVLSLHVLKMRNKGNQYEIRQNLGLNDLTQRHIQKENNIVKFTIMNTKELDRERLGPAES